jgi:hypothetical protein
MGALVAAAQETEFGLAGNSRRNRSGDHARETGPSQKVRIATIASRSGLPPTNLRMLESTVLCKRGESLTRALFLEAIPALAKPFRGV